MLVFRCFTSRKSNGLTFDIILSSYCRPQLSQSKILLEKSPMTIKIESLADKSWEKSVV